MSLLKLAWRNIRFKPLSAILNILLLSLAVSLISLTILISKNLDDNLKKNIKGVDMVIGANGSPLQIILSSLYHIDAAPGNISYAEAQEVAKHFLVETAIPLSYGDNYLGVKILGTTDQFAAHYQLQIENGRHFQSSFEVCIGFDVSNKLNLKIGDTFYSQHGLDNDGHQHENNAFKVVGIFKPSNSIADQLIVCNLEDIWEIHEEHSHEHEGHSHDHEEHDHDEHAHDHEEHTHDHSDSIEIEDREITAMLISFKNRNGFMFLPNMVNSKSTLQSALPSIEINRLFSLLGFGFNTLYGIATVLVLISGISIFISMLQALSSRKYELALLRSMGATKSKLLFLVLSESLILGLIGIFSGLLLSRIVTTVVSGITEKNYKYSLNSWALEREELFLIGITLLIALLASFLPALRARNLKISKVLADR